jgi:threonine dehydratase
VLHVACCVQGVALSAAKNNIKAVIVMPLATPQIKVNAVRSFGGPTVTIKLHGRNYDEAAAEAKRLSKEEGLTMVHPFDDPDVIAGQGALIYGGVCVCACA